MTGFSVYSLIRNCFPTRRDKEKEDGAHYQRLSTPDPSCAMFQDALHNNLDEVVPRSRTAKSRLAKVSNALAEKLKPKRRQQSSTSGTTRSGANVDTGFSNIFSYTDSASPSSPYHLRLNTGQTVQRSRKEAERHVLLQSYLRSAYGDPSIHESEVLSVEEVLHPLQRPPRSHDRTPPSTPRVDTIPPSPPEVYRTAAPIIETPVATPPAVGDLPAPHTGEFAQSIPTNNASSPGWASSWDFLSETPAYIPPPSETDLSPIPRSPVPSLSAMSDVNSVEPVQHQPVGAADVAASPLQANGYCPAQIEMIQFIEERLNLSPLDFFEAISRKDSTVAAHIAVQAAKMTTLSDAEVAPGAKFTPSMYPGINLQVPGHGQHFTGHIVQFADPAKSKNGNTVETNHCDLLPALLEDLKAEIIRQNNQIYDRNALLRSGRDPVLPAGVKSTRAHNPFVRSADSGLYPKVCNPDELVTVLQAATAEPAADFAGMVEKLAVKNPDLAAAFHLISQMLTIPGIGQATRCERHHYADKNTELGVYDGAGLVSDRSWFPTFIPGVQRNGRSLSAETGGYRTNIDGTWQSGKSSTDIFAMITTNAVGHLQRSSNASPEQPIYSLAVYELVAKAVSIPVPQYLIEHEHAVLMLIDANRAKKDADSERIAKLQKGAKDFKELSAVTHAQVCFDRNFTNRSQYILEDQSLDVEIIKGRSFERSFRLEPKTGNPLDFIRSIQTHQLAFTHTRQAISAREAPGKTPDHRCWLRSSWIPILSAFEPDVLVERFNSMHKSLSPIGQGQAAKLRTIAQQFKENTAEFLHPDGKGKSWIEQTGNAARLGRAIPPEQKTRNPAKHDLVNVPPENFLLNIQIVLAAAFRSRENPSLVRELENLDRPGTPASSDLPILLHCAFGIPLLVVETGRPTIDKDGNQSTLAPQIRVAAPKGSELAKLIDEAATENVPLDEQSEVLRGILETFSNLPIIWLEEGHFEVYIPNSQLTR